MSNTQSIQLAQLQTTFKDGKCPVMFADGQPVVFWCADGVMHAQFRSVHITDPATGSAEASPLVEITMTLPVFFSMIEGANAQKQLLEKQGIKPVAMAAMTPATPGGSAH